MFLFFSSPLVAIRGPRSVTERYHLVPPGYPMVIRYSCFRCRIGSATRRVPVPRVFQEGRDPVEAGDESGRTRSHRGHSGPGVLSQCQQQ